MPQRDLCGGSLWGLSGLYVDKKRTVVHFKDENMPGEHMWITAYSLRWRHI